MTNETVDIIVVLILVYLIFFPICLIIELVTLLLPSENRGFFQQLMGLKIARIFE